MSKIRTWVARRVMGRLRIDDDIVRHLSTFQRLGETFDLDDARHVCHCHTINDVTHLLPFLSPSDCSTQVSCFQGVAAYERW